MKNKLSSIFLLSVSLIFLPLFSFAQGDYGALAAILITALIVFVILGIVSIVFTVKYFKAGSRSSFLIALIPALVLYLLITYLLSWARGEGVFGLWQLIPLTIIGLLFYRQIKNKSESIWPYAILNLVTLSIVTILVFVVEISGDYAQILNYLFRGLGLLSYSLFTFLLTKTLLQSKSEIQTQDIYIKANLFLLVSYVISTIISLLRFQHVSDLAFVLRANALGFAKYLIPFIIAVNLTAFITIKFFPRKDVEKEDGFLL
ncbi:MAG TPA: hypothetical protein VGB84_06880 [Arachidicoccus sp.]